MLISGRGACHCCRNGMGVQVAELRGFALLAGASGVFVPKEIMQARC